MKHSIIIVFLLLVSCTKEDIIPEQDTTTEPITLPDQIAVIGKQVPNPYSLSNMKTAFSSLENGTKNGMTVDQIKATHLYIKFLPTCEEDLISLQKDESIYYFLYPLDHEVSDGLLVVDPDYSINGYQHRWAYIPVDKDLSHIECKYEILDEIFIPEDAIATKSTNFSNDLLEKLEIEANRICGIELSPIAETKAQKVFPSGNIQFWDDSKDKMRGCEGMGVYAIRLAHNAYGHCDANGNFVCNDSFKYNWTYHVYFSRTDFELRKDDSTNEIVYKYSGYHGPINLSWGEGSYESFYASILRAACKYYYGDIYGLQRPPLKADKGAKLAIQARLEYSEGGEVGHFYENPRFILSSRPIVNVYRKRKAYEDLVTGYTVPEIEEALKGCPTMESWKNNLLTLYPDKTDKDHVHEVFDYWNSI